MNLIKFDFPKLKYCQIKTNLHSQVFYPRPKIGFPFHPPHLLSQHFHPPHLLSPQLSWILPLFVCLPSFLVSSTLFAPPPQSWPLLHPRVLFLFSQSQNKQDLVLLKILDNVHLTCLRYNCYYKKNSKKKKITCKTSLERGFAFNQHSQLHTSTYEIKNSSHGPKEILRSNYMKRQLHFTVVNHITISAQLQELPQHESHNYFSPSTRIATT